MISSFFGQTKPINYAVLLAITLLVYCLVIVSGATVHLVADNLFFKFLGLLALLGTVFTINVVLKTNQLAELSSYAMLFFVLFLMAFYGMLVMEKILISNFFILLSINRVLALKFDKGTKSKIFEASLLVFCASIFHNGALVFLAPIFMGIYAYSARELRHWLLPLAALGTFALVGAAILTLLGDFSFVERHYKFASNLDFFNRFSWKTNAVLLGYLFLGSAVILMVLVKLGYRSVGRMVSLRLLLAYYFIALYLLFFADAPNVNPLLYSFYPMVIFVANYLETIKKHRHKEIIISAAIILAMAILILGNWT